MTDEIDACPSCNSGSLRYLSRSDENYRCEDCGHKFKDPVRKQPRNRPPYAPGNLGPGGRALLELDKDDKP